MGIHNSLSDFNQFPDMADEEDVGKIFINGIIQHFADVVADGDSLADVEAEFITAEIDAVVAKKGQEMGLSGGSSRIHFGVNRVDQGLFAHGIDDA